MTQLIPNFAIGITGKAGHGKDSLATLVSEELQKLELPSYIIRFADPIKDAYATMFSIDRNKLEELDFKNQVNPITGTTHRQELQFMGTEAYRVRLGRPDIWIDALAARAEMYTNGSIYPIIIPDARFDNEARFITHNGLLIKIERPGQPETVNSSHVSEAGVSVMPHLTITNDGTLNDLRVKAAEVAKLAKLKYGTYRLGIKEVKMSMFM